MPPMRFDHIVSLGGACAPAWQIRTFTGRDTAYPFDWLVLPFDSLVGLIERDFDGFMAPDAFSPMLDRKAIRNTRFPCMHLHDFPNPVRDEGWRALVPGVMERYRFLIGRWRDLVAGDARVLFVRQQGHCDPETFVFDRDLGPAEIAGLVRLIETRCPRLRFEILLVNAAGRIDPDPRVHSASVSWDAAADWPDPAERWRGATGQWQALLAETAAP